VLCFKGTQLITNKAYLYYYENVRRIDTPCLLYWLGTLPAADKERLIETPSTGNGELVFSGCLGTRLLDCAAIKEISSLQFYKLKPQE
jgi:hypothetical protein